eukprot:363885-Chlamydomonas_euryale.AAC.30
MLLSQPPPHLRLPAEEHRSERLIVWTAPPTPPALTLTCRRMSTVVSASPAPATMTSTVSRLPMPTIVCSSGTTMPHVCMPMRLSSRPMPSTVASLTVLGTSAMMTDSARTTASSATRHDAVRHEASACEGVDRPPSTCRARRQRRVAEGVATLGCEATKIFVHHMERAGAGQEGMKGHAAGRE